MFICCDACSWGYNHFGLLFGRMLRCAIVCTYDPCHRGYGRCLLRHTLCSRPMTSLSRCMLWGDLSVLICLSLAWEGMMYYTIPALFSVILARALIWHDRWLWNRPPGLSVCYGLAVATNWPICNMFGHLIWCSILRVFDLCTICVRVCVDIGWCDFICWLDAIQVVYVRDMVRLAQCVLPYLQWFGAYCGYLSSSLHCHDFVHICMC